MVVESESAFTDCAEEEQGAAHQTRSSSWLLACPAVTCAMQDTEETA